MTEGLSPLRDRLRKAALALGVPIDVVEFDYGLSYAARGALGEAMTDSGFSACDLGWIKMPASVNICW